MSDHQAIDTALQRHYSHGALAAAIDRSLVKLGKDPAALTVDDLALIDEFHIGGRPASLALFDQCGFAEGMHLLDVGSGLGGPARACAFAKGATVTGVDLTPEFVEVARTLATCGARLGNDVPAGQRSRSAVRGWHLRRRLHDPCRHEHR